MKKKNKLIVKTTLEMMSAKKRNALIESGLYGAHKNKCHKSKKAYNRKKVKLFLRKLDF